MFANLWVNRVLDGEMTWEDLADHINALMKFPWYVDGEGFLYIVDRETAEVHGPESEPYQEAVADGLWEFLSKDTDSEWDAAEKVSQKVGVDVFYIPFWQRRFDKLLGFYHV